jgi:hypothetical protein
MMMTFFTMRFPFFLEKLLRPQLSALQLSEKKDKYSPLRDLNQYGGPRLPAGRNPRHITRRNPAVGLLGASGIVSVRCGDTFAATNPLFLNWVGDAQYEPCAYPRA